MWVYQIISFSYFYILLGCSTGNSGPLAIKITAKITTIPTKKEAWFKWKLTDNVGKPKELWKDLKSLGLEFESSISNISCLENNKSANFDVKDIAEDFSVCSLNLAENHVSKLSNPSNKYGVLSVAQYYSHLRLSEKIHLLHTEKGLILKNLRDIDTTKVAGIYRLPGRFLKDGVNVLAKPVTDTCSLSVSLKNFSKFS